MKNARDVFRFECDMVIVLVVDWPRPSVYCRSGLVRMNVCSREMKPKYTLCRLTFAGWLDVILRCH